MSKYVSLVHGGRAKVAVHLGVCEHVLQVCLVHHRRQVAAVQRTREQLVRRAQRRHASQTLAEDGRVAVHKRRPRQRRQRAVRGGKVRVAVLVDVDAGVACTVSTRPALPVACTRHPPQCPTQSIAQQGNTNARVRTVVLRPVQQILVPQPRRPHGDGQLAFLM